MDRRSMIKGAAAFGALAGDDQTSCHQIGLG